MKKGITALAFLLLAGCGGCFSYSQVPPKNPDIVYTWTAPLTGCASGCSYILSMLQVATGTTTCPASTGTNYTPVNESAPVSATTYTFLSAPQGTLQCAVVQASNGILSLPSAPSNVVSVPTAPPAPGAPQGSQQTASVTEPGNKTLADNRSFRIESARVEWK